MICVLDVTHGPARGRRFWIRTNETVQIGRISTADFPVPSDRHMSRHHLILEGGSKGFRVRDVGSANGTFVNDAKVSVIDLCNGDRIKAGETVFEVSVLDNDQNPYAENDITTPSASGSKVASPEAEMKRASMHSGDIHGSHVAEAVEVEENSGIAEFGFIPTQDPGFFEQEANIEHVQLNAILRRLSVRYVISAMLSTGNLRRFDKQLLEGLDREGLVTWHDDSRCSVLCGGEEQFFTLAESLLGQDMMVLVASFNGIDPSLLRNLAQGFSTVTAFRKQIHQLDNALAELLPQFDFAIYEQDSDGRLSLFLKDAPQ